MAMTTQQTYQAPAAKKVKLEHEGSAPSTPQPASSTSSTPVPSYSTAAQWSTPIPIDPALQQSSQAAVSQATPMSRLTYQHYTPYGSTHYPQAAYASHYAQYQTAAVSTATTTPAPTSTTTAQPIFRQPTQVAAPTTNTTNTNESESNVDISTLNDALGSAGLDLRAEEETLQRSQDYHSTYRSYEDRSRKQASNPNFDARILGTTMRSIATQHKVTRVPEDSVSYVALALRARLQSLIKEMISASEHRSSSQFDRAPGMYEEKLPMWGVNVRRDTRKQLELLERIEREEEMKLRRERRERLDAQAAQTAQAAAGSPSGAGGAGTAEGGTGGGAGGGGGSGANGGAGAGGEDADSAASGKRPKKKKDGPGVTAKNMSEDVQKRLSNATAAQAAGLGRGKYAWMNAGGVGAVSSPAPSKSKAVKQESGGTSSGGGATGSGGTNATGGTGTGAATPTPGSSSTSTWAKPYISAAAKASSSPAPGDEDKTVITMHDAVFVIEQERGHGGGRGSARGWV